MRDFEKGDIIYVIRAPLTVEDKQKAMSLGFNWITYRHYGIATGNSSVIHFVGSSGYFSGDISIRQTSIDKFAKGGVVDSDSYSNIERVYSREEVINRAYSKLHTNFGGYNLFTNNCEHFANWASNGRKGSRQTGYNPDQDIVSNFIDQGAAAVDRVFDPLIRFGDKIDKILGWGDYRK